MKRNWQYLTLYSWPLCELQISKQARLLLIAESISSLFIFGNSSPWLLPLHMFTETSTFSLVSIMLPGSQDIGKHRVTVDWQGWSSCGEKGLLAAPPRALCTGLPSWQTERQGRIRTESGPKLFLCTAPGRKTSCLTLSSSLQIGLQGSAPWLRETKHCN